MNLRTLQFCLQTFFFLAFRELMRFGIQPSFLGSSFPDSSCPRTVVGSQGSVLGHLLLSPLALFWKSCPASHYQLSYYEDPVCNYDCSRDPVPWLQLPAGHFISDVWQLVIFRIEIMNLVPICLPLQTSRMLQHQQAHCAGIPSYLSNSLSSSLYSHIRLATDCFDSFTSVPPKSLFSSSIPLTF